MKEKVFALLMRIVVFAMFLSLIFATLVFYMGFERQVFRDLETTAHIYAAAGMDDSEKEIFFNENIRISLIERDGTVVYDNNAEVKEMENHIGRKEVREALESGSGKAIRRSDTLEKSLFYVAVLLEDGRILRVSRESDNVLSFFLYQSLPIFAIMLLPIFVLCMLLARYFTNRLVKPIEELANNLDKKDRVETYPELMPLLDMIRKQHEDIMKAARIRQDFTANVSHELKTPLTVISGYSELIENGMATEENTRRFAGEIHKNAARQLTLINDIIRLSELDTTDEADSFESVNLYQIAEACVNMLQVNAEKHHVQISFSGESCQVFSTKEMMEELLYNLCDNAIRYNKEGGSVAVSVKNTVKGVALAVKDTGIGISQKHQERIFERFYRVDKSRSKSTGGTGLGLAIVKHIVAQVNGKMELESEPGRGTEIRIVFPQVTGV